jgi:hypothetical protein
MIKFSELDIKPPTSKPVLQAVEELPGQLVEFI